MGLNLKSLIGKLNDQARSALEAAAGLCLSRTHYDIEIEHYLMKLLDSSDGDFAPIAKQFGVDTSRLTAELSRGLDKLKSGNARTPALSPTLLKMLTEAWTLGSIEYNAGQIRTGFTVLALASNDELARMMRDISKEFQKIDAESLRKDFLAIVANSQEEARGAELEEPGAEPAKKAAGGKTPNLDQYTVNLTENAKAGKDRSGARPRFRDSAGGRHPHPPPPEQSDPGRRSGRRQDGGGGRLRAAHRQWRRAAVAEERHRCARSTWRCCRRARREGRVRESAEGADRGSEVLAHADHSVHRRSAHDDRRRRPGGTERCRQPAQAGAGARRTAHHRGDDVVRIQEVLREGSRARPPLPGREGGGADRRRSAW